MSEARQHHVPSDKTANSYRRVCSGDIEDDERITITSEANLAQRPRHLTLFELIVLIQRR